MNNSFNVLILKLFEARQIAHLAHFATKSFSKHEALDVFYTQLLPLIDKLVEVYQGEFGLIELASISPAQLSQEMAPYLRQLAKQLKSANQNLSGSYSYYANIIDEITALVYRTVYKLENLG